MIGQQQCVRECRHRPKLCRGVNYQKQELLCELVSAINETEPKLDYVRIELDQTDRVPDECMSCSTDDLCVTLSSKKVHCIRGNDKLHHLLSQGTYEMRMDMEDFDNQTRYVKYSSFNVGDESTKYTVTLSGFSGDVEMKSPQGVWVLGLRNDNPYMRNFHTK
uniref:Ficolin-1 n=1 Tax=Magallana gigas TaxID=29159 RepID=K1RJC3_MAGGI